VVLYSKSVFLVSLFATNIVFASYLIGPLFYWYIRSTLSDNPGLRKRDLFHLLPMVVYLAAALPYMLSSYSYKLGIATEIVNDPEFLRNFKFTPLADIFSIQAVYISRPLLALGYTLWSIGLLIRYLKKRSILLVFSGQRFMIKWLSFLSGLQLLVVVSHILLISNAFLNSTDVFYTLNLLQIVSSISITGLMVSPLFFPDILYGLPRFSEQVSDASPEELSEEDQKMPLPVFESDYIMLIEQKTEAFIQEFQPYLQPELNLYKFSDNIELPVHHLAYFFREVKKQTFNDFRNECRIKHAKSLLMEGKGDEMTLEAIGKLSGFSSRNTFLRAFKKAEGITPEAFASRVN
jgi:AraC-like DNA-binding protein